jgi:hypothetical protein
MNRYTTDYFTWYRPDRSFCACSSNLNIRAIDPIPQRFELESTRTGEVIEFKCVNVVSDLEGDIQCWEYTCSTHPFKATIFND